MPGLAVAAQAFLLTVGLRGDVTSLARLVASLAGLLAALAAAHLYTKNVYLFDFYEAIESERIRLNLPGVQLDAFKKMELPANTQYVQRNWETSCWRQCLVVRRKAANIWLFTLLGFAVLDLLLLVYAAGSLIGHDPGWLTHRPTQ